MIVEFLITLIVSVITFVISIFPTFSLPVSSIETATDTVHTWLANVDFIVPLDVLSTVILVWIGIHVIKFSFRVFSYLIGR